jgi:hypothetical protein
MPIPFPVEIALDDEHRARKWRSRFGAHGLDGLVESESAPALKRAVAQLLGGAYQ